MQKAKKKEKIGIWSAVKTISGSIREYKKPSILAPLFIAMEVVFECLIPWLLTLLLGAMEYIAGTSPNPDPLSVKIVDFISAGKEPNLIIVILWFALVLLVLAILSLTCGALSGRFCSVASNGFAKNLRQDMFKRIQGFSFSNIDKFSTSSLVTRMTTDVTNVQMSYMMIIRTAIRSPMLLTFSVITAYTMGGALATSFVVVIPVLIFGLFMVSQKAMPAFRRVFKKYDKLNKKTGLIKLKKKPKKAKKAKFYKRA